MSKWNEITSDYFNEDEQCVYIEGFLTEDENEEGIVIAKVHDDRIEYTDTDAKTDIYAKEVIQDTVNNLNFHLEVELMHQIESASN
jgi:hypothetical protein